MWYLSFNNDARVVYFTPECKEVIVGRNSESTECDLEITDDASISRRHASVSVSEDGLLLQDLGSTYGTYINNATVRDQRIMLKDADVIKFGKLNCLWTVRKVDLVSSSSTLKEENLQNLKASLCKVGGFWKNDWDESCTFLTMPGITLTMKVVLALVQGAHIVLPDYWEHCFVAIKNQSKLPDPTLFTPQIIESTLNTENVSFLPNNKRKSIYDGKKFVFFSRRQMEMYKTVILKSLGTPLLLSETKLTKAMLATSDVIVVHYSNISNTTAEQQVKHIEDITNYLKSKGKRLVPDSEIGLAVLYASLEKHCNPDFSIHSEFVKTNITPISTVTSSVLAKETQDIDENSVKQENILIDESLTSHCDNLENGNDVTMIGNSNKRKLSNDGAILNSSAKRQTIEHKYENNDSQELFNFIGEDPSENRTEKKLNFALPQKRKADHITENEDDELFNFLPEQTDDSISKKLHIFGKDNICSNSNSANFKKPRLDHAQDITPLRGVKAQELTSDDVFWKSCIKSEIKKEQVDADDLGNKLNGLDLGCTIITIREDLIKKERKPPVIETKMYDAENFKKFKKVWPVKMQVTLLPITSTSSVKSSSGMAVVA